MTQFYWRCPLRRCEADCVQRSAQEERARAHGKRASRQRAAQVESLRRGGTVVDEIVIRRHRSLTVTLSTTAGGSCGQRWHVRRAASAFKKRQPIRTKASSAAFVSLVNAPHTAAAARAPPSRRPNSRLAQPPSCRHAARTACSLF